MDTIRDLREQIGVERSALGRDVVIHLHKASANAKRLSADQTKDALLDAAETIRTLKTVLDGKEDAMSG